MLELKRVAEIVEEDHTFAYVLDCYGIEFYKCPEKVLGEVCQQKGVNFRHLSENLTSVKNFSRLDKETLRSYPLDLVIEYLKHAHYVFLKKSLPFMGKLIRNLDEERYEIPELIKDLKFVFPLFMEDFIHHIYEEEDEVFHYLGDLFKVRKKEIPFSKVFNRMETLSLREIADHHHDADDEMRGIRDITINYTLGLDTDLHLRTIYRELQAFEKELLFHASVENDILFPKAIQLETEVLEDIKEKVVLN